MKDGHGGVVLGSEMSGGIRNVFVEDCQMDSPNLDRAIRLKSNSLRGGYLENLFVRNVQVGQVTDAVVRINLNYDKDRGEHYPTVRNIFIENVTSEKSKYPFYFVGLEDAKIRQRGDRELHVQERGQAERDRKRRTDHAPQLPPAAQGRHRPNNLAGGLVPAYCGCTAASPPANRHARCVRRRTPGSPDPLRRDDPQIVACLAAVVARVDHVAVLAGRAVGVEGVAD